MTDTHTGSATPNDRPEGASTDKTPAKPKIGDTRAAPPAPKTEDGGDGRQRNRSRGRGGQNKQKAPSGDQKQRQDGDGGGGGNKNRNRRRRRGGKGRGQANKPVELATDIDAVELDAEQLEARKGKHRNGKPVGRYLMAVHKTDKATQIAVLEGRNLIEHYVSRPADDISQIHGNIYLAKVANVLPGMEAAFVDIGTPKNAVLYRSDVSYDPDDVEGGGKPRIEDVLKAKQTIICQVTKNPIGVKGARLTQEVSLPGRFVVLVPNSSTYGISKRLPDNERKRLRKILDGAKPKQHGVIVRTAAENVTSEEIANDVKRLVALWDQIEGLADKSQAPTLLYREPDVAVRVIREEFSNDYRSVVIDDKELYDDALDYVSGITPALADRVQFYDTAEEKLPLFERHHVHEQLHKALDRKVWLPSGGSLIIEHTEALTVIDVNTGKNVGKSNLEDTVYKNNLEAAEAIAHQLRLRDIGGIIVIDFIDMEIKKNREDVARALREALARDKTRTQVFDISELGLVEMTRKRIGEGLLDSFTDTCEVCAGRGMVFDRALLNE
ncbi:MAG: Rne/Rng family ribonuclease [Acidimicrobiales bacterium]|nr:Rne/Rng family ribonuclease [Acidimicrobiales bacterium]